MLGRSPAPLPEPEVTEARELVDAVNRLLSFMGEVRAAAGPLSQGRLHEVSFRPDNYLASALRELQSRLLHLSWQARQVAQGDYSQRVDFMGELSETFNAMVEALAENQRQLQAKIGELEEALARVRRLEGILPICAHCKKIRVEGADPWREESWQPVEQYLGEHGGAEFTHGLCPECLRRYFPDTLA